MRCGGAVEVLRGTLPSCAVEDEEEDAKAEADTEEEKEEHKI